MIKSFKEMMAVDLGHHISKKPVFKKDKASGQFKQVGELDYLNWAACLMLLHEHGAEKVCFGNMSSDNNHPVFLLDGGVPFVRVFVEVDGDYRVLDYPVIDGSNNVSMEKLTQGDVHNATQRGFVKCVAINWGLGLKLWQKEEQEEEQRRSPADNLEFHNIMAIKTRVERYITSKLQAGMSMEDVLSILGLSDAQYKNTMRYFDGIAAFEQRLTRL